MRATVAVFFSLLLNLTMAAQVGINTTSPHASSMLDITASDKGLLIPRVNLTSVNDLTTIPSPATGLLVYKPNSSSGMLPGFYYFNGTRWQAVTGSGGAGSDDWTISGNSNITPNNFLGTTNYQSLMFRVNNAQVGRFHPGGSIVLGFEAQANDNNSIAIGRNARASNSNEATAIGPQTNAAGFQSIALGYSAISSENQATALGFQARSRAQNGVSIGTNSIVTGQGSVALGHTSRASGEFATAIGYQSEATSHNSVALGNIAKATGQFGTALGSNTSADGYDSAAVGSNSRASGQRSSAFGYNNSASGYESTAGGANTRVTAQNASAFGYNNVATGYESMVVGMQSTANAQYSMAIGRGAVANQASTIIIGNSLPPSDYLGSKIGIGTNTPAAGARLDVNDPFKLGNKGTVHKGISSFESQSVFITGGTGTFDVAIPSEAQPSSLRATIVATIPIAASENLSIVWVRLVNVSTLRVKYALPGPTFGENTRFYFTITEF